VSRRVQAATPMRTAVQHDATGRVTERIRPATEDELPACAAVWRASINDYIVPLGQREIPDDLTAVTGLYRHTRSTDPERFVVALDADDRIVAFASAVVREPVWFLSMLFVLPQAQGQGLGRRLLEHVRAGTEHLIHATATDALQPISNALYASAGIVPRVPLWNLIGRPDRPGAFPPLPADIHPVTFDEIVTEGRDDDALAAVVDRADEQTVGFRHPIDHRWIRPQKHGFVYRRRDGVVVGYGYAGESGRIGPIAVDDDALLAPVLGHLLDAVEPRGASAVWVAGDAGDAIRASLGAGLRIEGFPLLLAWDRPFADLRRYVPISPGLL
jgi:GNAT superfamily N-acetyltransferase